MRLYSYLIFVLIVSSTMAGCISDGTAGKDGETGPEGPKGMDGADGSSLHVVDSVEGLPTCDPSIVGQIYFVSSSGGFQYCTILPSIEPGWMVVNLTGPAGQAGNDGQNGIDGAHGTHGENGSNGSSGLTTLATTTLEPEGDNCQSGGVKISVGIDINGNGVLEEVEKLETSYICNGLNGNDGLNGSSSSFTMLTDVSSPSQSLGCTAGGRVIKQGLDNGDNSGVAQNGILESGEVDYRTTYCSYYDSLGAQIPYKVKTENGSNTTGIVNTNIEWQDLPSLDGLFFFIADDDVHGIELWAYSYVNNSSWMVKDLYQGATGSNPHNPIIVNETLFFCAQSAEVGFELWAYTPKNDTVWLTADINNGTNSSLPGYYMMENVGNTIYFDASDGVSGTELWAFNLSNTTSWQVADVNSGSGGSSPCLRGSAVVIDSTIMFTAWNGDPQSTAGWTLWAHDDNSQMTWEVNANLAIAEMFAVLDTTLYFSAYLSAGTQMWAYDVSNESTWFIKFFGHGSTGKWLAQQMSVVIDDTIYFDADDGTTGSELWAHDTSNGTTWLVYDINSGENHSEPGYVVEILDKTIYFAAENGSTYPTRTIWAHNTENHSTWELSPSILLDSQGGGMIEVHESTIYLQAWDANGSELWAFDTLNQSSWQMFDLSETAWLDSWTGKYFSRLDGNMLYFSGYDGRNTGEMELWGFELSGISHKIYYD